MLIDTHCHLHDREFFSEEQAEEMVKRANARGVEKIVCIGTDPEDSMAAREFAAKNEGVYWTYGIHPGNPDYTADNFVRDEKLVAIGEVGFDFHCPEGEDSEHAKDLRYQQIRLLDEMLQLAVDNNLPVSFHVREGFDDFFPALYNFPRIRGVIHCFSDSKKNLRRILEETDLYVGVTGLATYSTLPTPPLERILLETDAPFLTPKPFRGIINESSYIPEIAAWLSEKLGVELEVIERETTKNARELFGF